MTNAPWAVTDGKVNKAVKEIVRAANPKRVILFGSYVRGDVRRDSDLDILVVTAKTVKNPRREGVRLRRALRGIPMSMDILVVSEKKLARLRDTPGLIYREAVRNGKVAYESP
jgi:predicted nucleotidyltransferase